jgi:AraC family cel operon transcriptional repressor
MRRVSLSSYILGHEHFHYARRIVRADVPVEIHDHDCHELLLVEDGELQHEVNGKAVIAPKGTLIFIRPRDMHALKITGEKPARILNVMFRNQTANHLGTRYSEEYRGRFFWSRDKLPETRLLTGPRMERAINTSLELQTSFRTLARIEEYLLTILTRVVDYEPPVSTRMPTWLKAACMASRQPEVFRKGTQGFIEVAGRGHEHVCRTTKRILGISPSAYLNRCRMEYAAMLLTNTEKLIPEIADSCGINNMAYFHRLFRSQYGTTPLRYRKESQMNSKTY